MLRSFFYLFSGTVSHDPSLNDVDSFALFNGNPNLPLPKSRDIVEEIPLRVFGVYQPSHPLEDNNDFFYVNDEHESLL